MTRENALVLLAQTPALEQLGPHVVSRSERGRASLRTSDGRAVITTVEGGVVLDVRVIPRAGRSGLAGTRDDALLVRLGAAPVDGAANAELVAVLADEFDVPRRNVAIIAGDRSRQKRVRLVGVTAEQAAAIVAAAGSRG
jgi:uncharacterized protein (TIGR00251 family)